ncbi:hypothetical protein [Flavivirga rizhaonensis]|uniref:Uncharacterized protein n=1 Tax=Flavivirga rizhaonensis TaxID=2559571 RepID=A0A4S1DZC7_9FLAO|nr:hypothetical protein [Flavivirga rizhaonensis]TGV03375.1 hypothetical protein EM932_06795 [Flavivirga rizhaonensis]
MMEIGKCLHEIAKEYRNLEPIIARMRQNPEFKANTFLPNPLLPIAPAIAYGYRPKTCLDALRELEKYEIWAGNNKIKQKITKLYTEGFVKQFDNNNVIWMGWNYWQPSGRLYEKDKRNIQLLCADDKEFADFIRNNGEPSMDMGGIGLNKQFFINHGRTNIQGNEVIDEDNLSEDVKLCRNYSDGVWDLLFTRSINYFREERNLNTVVDFIRDQYHEYLNHTTFEQNHDILKPIEIIFDPSDAMKPNESTDIHSFVMTLDEFDCFWGFMLKEYSSSDLAQPEEYDNDAIVSKLIATWDKISKMILSEMINQDVLNIITRFAKKLNIPKDRYDEAYIILQHFCLLKKFMFADCQYVIPIVFGKQVSVMYLSFKKPIPLPMDAIEGWMSIAYQLFSSLFIEHLSNIQNSYKAEQEAATQREMLRHALPKFVFKPLEYFLIDILNTSNNFEKNKNKGIETIVKNTEAAWFLSGIGQQQLKQYSESKEAMNNGTRANLRGICETLEQVFEKVKPLYINGFTDQYDGVNNKNILTELFDTFRNKPKSGSIREQLNKDEHITIEKGEYIEHENAFVIGNETIITMHLWNIIENSLLHSEISVSDGIKIAIEISEDESKNSCLMLQFICTNPTMDNEILQILNGLFKKPSSTQEFEQIKNKLKIIANSKIDQSGFQHEHRGRGLIAFAQYLNELWGSTEQDDQYENKNIFGEFELNSLYLKTKFYFPKSMQ